VRSEGRGKNNGELRMKQHKCTNEQPGVIQLANMSCVPTVLHAANAVDG